MTNEILTDSELTLLEYIYQDVELPVFEITLQPHETVRKQQNLYDAATQKFLTKPTSLLVADDGRPDQSLKSITQTDSALKLDDKKIIIKTQLDDAWQLRLCIVNEDNTPFNIERVRIGNVPAFQDNNNPAIWNFNLQFMDNYCRRNFLEQPIFVHLNNGYQIKCMPPFI
ncbi:MAG: hypothetical protein LBP59_00825 [Planctomycetaceae bacterium]|jgi:hypothetical protein|nr:hypothetical protein [Planctomycetaceae bacterium]